MPQVRDGILSASPQSGLSTHLSTQRFMPGKSFQNENKNAVSTFTLPDRQDAALMLVKCAQITERLSERYLHVLCAK